MKDFIIKFINLIFYSNLWIAACALAMAFQSQLLFGKTLNASAIMGVVFFATWFIYAVHRIVALQKVKDFQSEGRYLVISTFKHHIVIYAAIAAIGGFIAFWGVSRAVQISLIIPAFISLAYVFPVFKGNLRIRDFNYVKIFLIALVWAWVTVLLPALEWGKIAELSTWMMAAERFVFIFSITLPFDIRDLKIDEQSEVKTIPARIGIPRTKYLAYGCLLLMLVFSSLNVYLNFYNYSHLLALSISALTTGVFIYFSDHVEHDYYFTGLMDGTMVLQFLLVWGSSYHV